MRRSAKVARGMDERVRDDLQGEHPSHVPKSLPVAVPGREHGGVGGCAAEAILQE